MMIPTLILASALRLLPALEGPPWSAPEVIADLGRFFERSQTAGPPPSYQAAARNVSNWRAETAATLEPKPLAAAAALIDADRPVVTRCVKLNNPWCIKHARWDGEIGADDEGHTAFASTAAAADAAAALLRTYYVDAHRRSALDIVRRWAPAECRPEGGGLSLVLAVHGLASTLRGRFLITHGRGGVARRAPGGRRVAGRAGRRVRMTISVVPVFRPPDYHVPDIAAGMGERPASRPAKTAAAQPPVQAPVPKSARMRRLPTLGQRRVAEARARGAAVPASEAGAAGDAAIDDGLAPSLACGSGEQRIRNYATAIAKVVGRAPSADLDLFGKDGEPRANLLPVLVAMSGVELGYLHAGPELVAAAVERMKERLALAAPTDAGPVPTPR